MTAFTPSNNSAANNSATRRSVNEPSHKTAFEHLRSVLLRGGRITKFKGIAASIAPMMAAAVAPALMAGAISVGGAGSAWAVDECGAQAVGPDTVNCAAANYATGITYNDSDGMTLIINGPGFAIGDTGVMVFSSTATDAITVIGTDVGTLTAAPTGQGLFVWIVNSTSTATATAILTAGDIVTTGVNSYGLSAETSGLGDTLVQMDGGTVTTSGLNGDGLRSAAGGNAASTATATAILTAGDIVTTGVNSNGLSASTSGLGDTLVQMDGGTVTIGGENSRGLLTVVSNAASTATATALLTAGDIVTTGRGSSGLYVQTNGLGDALAQMDGGTVTTGGLTAEGLTVWIVNSTSTATATAILTAGDIVTTGDNSHGLFVRANGLGGALAQMDGGTVTTGGERSYGLHSVTVNAAATTATATALLTDGDVVTTGRQAHALYAQTNGLADAVISATGGTVVASGVDAHGAYAESTAGGNTEVTIDTSVTGGSGLGYAVNTQTRLDLMSTITIGDNAIISAASGLAIQNNEGDSATTVAAGAQVAGEINLRDGDDALTFNGTDIANITRMDGGDDTLLADTFIDTLNFNGVTGTTLGANVTNWEEVHVGAGSTISFSDGMLTVGDITEPTTGLYVDAGGILDQGGIGLDLMGNMFNTGIITTQDGTAGDTITVSGNYTGGGQLLVDTVLGDDTSASDTLVIEGDVSGMTDVVVANVGGTGAQTTTGILVVDVNGVSPADGFALANGDYVIPDTGEDAIIAGAYAYAWRQIGSDWYLQSSLVPEDLMVDDDDPLYQPAAPVYEVYPQTLLGMMTLPTMQQRVGNRYWKEAGPAPVQQTVYCKDPAMNFECAVNNEQADYYADKAKEQARMDDGAIWARVEGAHNHVEPVSSTSGVSSYETDQWRLQAGIDGLAHESGKGDRLFVGINGSYGTSSSQISSAFGSGSIDTTAYSLGATATWLATNGAYVDLQGSYAWFDSDLSSDMAAIGSLVDGNDGTGYALSAEFGKKIDVHNNWTFTPQVQLSYAAVDFDSFTGPSGEAVSLGDADSLKLRLGISADRDASWTDDNGMKQRAHLYAIANVIHDFNPETSVMVTGTPLTSERDAWTGEVGLGFTRNFNDDKYSVYGEVNAATGLENFGDSYKLGGTLGVRVSF